MTLEAHYKALIAQASNSLDTLLQDGQRLSAFTSVHNHSADYETIISVIGDRPESAIFDLALKEFHLSLFASVTGSYRQAHAALRLFLELVCAGVFFSAYEIKLRSWLAGAEGSDITWATISSPDCGIFSTNFLRAFHPNLSSHGKQYLAIATKTYRECSEFVHGNINTHTPETIPMTYRSDDIDAWIERAEAVRLCILFSFAGRYLRLIDKSARNKVGDIMLDSFGHFPAIQAIYT